MIIALTQGDITLEYDSRENLSYLVLHEQYSQDYTVEETKELLTQMLLHLEGL